MLKKSFKKMFSVVSFVKSTIASVSGLHSTIFIYLFTGCAMSGLIADSKTLIDKARVEAQVS